VAIGKFNRALITASQAITEGIGAVQIDSAACQL
jgi:hypothetical protein